MFRFTIELVAIAMNDINGTPAPLLRRGEKIEEEEREEKYEEGGESACDGLVLRLRMGNSEVIGSGNLWFSNN